MFHKKSLVLVYLILGISACAQPSNWQGRTRGSAPTSAKDTGVVLEGAKRSDIDSILEKHPAAKVRTLNETHGMYEVFNVALDDVHASFQGVAEKNEFFALAEKRRGLVKPGFAMGDLNPCREGDVAPRAMLALTTDGIDINHATIKLGATVHIDASASQPVPGETKPLKIDIAIQTAQGSSTNEIQRIGAESDFTPDAMGLYVVNAIVQGENQVCSAGSISFAVTDQRPFVHAAPDLQNIDITLFSHLGLVNAEEAWKFAQGDGMVVAIIDTGVNYNHPSLNPNILINEAEIPANGIDDEGNGYIDDYAGLDVVNHSPWPFDDAGHGSNVAGLAASKDFGIAKHAKILPVKALTPFGGDVGSIAAGVRYAVDRGANVINMSMGNSNYPPQILLDAFAYAESKNVLIVAATGNGDPHSGLGYDIDRLPIYPASLHLPNMITVSAFDSSSVLSPYSNFGAKSADVVAPGGSRQDPMVSCNYENPRGQLLIGMSGTSMATPIVSGVALLTWGQNKQQTYRQLREKLLKAGPEMPELKPITVSGRHINALAAVTADGSI